MNACCRNRAILLFLACLIFCLAGHARAATRDHISLFDVSAVLDADGTMTVTETLDIFVQSPKQLSQGVFTSESKIRHGIIRDIPLVWRDGKEEYAMQCEILAVTRNGRKEPYDVNGNSRWLSLRTGSQYATILPGTHRYAIHYKVSGHIAFQGDRSILNWNATGVWEFPINNARFRLVMPETASGPVIPRLDGVFAGAYGKTESDAAQTLDGTASAPHGLAAGEEMTVIFSWPTAALPLAGGLKQFSTVGRFSLLTVPDMDTLYLFLVPLVLGLYALYIMRTNRKSGEKPTVIPELRPPDGLSPGAVRYIFKAGEYDGTALAADILNMAVKGTIRLEPSEKKGRVRALYAVPGNEERLSPEELATYRTLFPDGAETAPLENAHEEDGTAPIGAVFRQALALGRMQLLKTYEGVVLPTGEYDKWVPFGAWAALCLLACIAVGGWSPAAWGVSLPVICWTIGLAVGPLFRPARVKRTGHSRELVGAAVSLFLLFAMFDTGSFFWLPQPPPKGFASAVALVMLVGWLKPRLALFSRDGLRLLAKAEGLKMYLETAEQDRMEMLYPPDAAIERYEKLMPYAVALDAARTWTENMATHIESLEMDAESEEFETMTERLLYIDWPTFTSDVKTLSSPAAARESDTSRDDDFFSGDDDGIRSGGNFSGGGFGGGHGKGW